MSYSLTLLYYTYYSNCSMTKYTHVAGFKKDVFDVQRFYHSIIEPLSTSIRCTPFWVEIRLVIKHAPMISFEH